MLRLLRQQQQQLPLPLMPVCWLLLLLCLLRALGPLEADARVVALSAATAAAAGRQQAHARFEHCMCALHHAC